MSHVFGMEHTLSGILDQIGGFFSDSPSPVAGAGFVAPPSIAQGGISGDVIDDVFGSGAGTTGPSLGAGSCGTCPPGTKSKRYITTVCPDGSVKTREAKSRRRRRRLASVSDIKDLAALKNVLGGGKAFDSWIATRGR